MKNGIKFGLLSVALSGVLLASCKHDEQDKSVTPVRVETLVLSESPVTAGRTYSGVIDESSGTVLSFKIPGTLVNLAVSEGQFVSKGQLIGQVDGSSIESNLRIAEASEATAQDTYNRMKMLHDANALPDIKWVEVQNALAAAKSATKIARNAVNDTKIYAPTISDSTKAYITVGALDNYSATATLADKGMIADPLSRTYTVKFTCANNDKKMLPGMLCTVTLSTNQTSHAMVVPVGAVLLDSENNSFVWLDKDGKSVKREVTLGGYTNDGVIIESGLTAGESVIVKGMQKISEGMPVETIKK